MTTSKHDVQALIEKLASIRSSQVDSGWMIPEDLEIIAQAEDALSALSGETETEWAAKVTGLSDHSRPVYYEYPDRLSVERFIRNPPLWYRPRTGEKRVIVSRRKAGEWEVVV